MICYFVIMIVQRRKTLVHISYLSCCYICNYKEMCSFGMHLELLGTMKTNNNNRKDLKMNNNDTTLSPMVVPLTASIYGALIYGIYLIFMVTI